MCAIDEAYEVKFGRLSSYKATSFCTAGRSPSAARRDGMLEDDGEKSEKTCRRCGKFPGAVGTKSGRDCSHTAPRRDISWVCKCC